MRLPHPLLAGLLATSAVVSLALVWAGWRLIDQQRDLDARVAEEQAEAAADAMASGIREKLADLGERLGAPLAAVPASLATPLSSSLQTGAAIVLRRSNAMDVEPTESLPFVPVVPDPPAASPLFAAGEAAEYSANGLPAAAAAYARLADHADPAVRASALLRLGRVLRKSGRAIDALRAYERLATLGALPTETTGVPASLVGLDGLRLAYRQLHDVKNEQRAAAEMAQRLDRGAWQLTLGAAEFYRDEVTQSPRPENWRLAAALTEAWPADMTALSPRGHTVVGDPPVLVLWRASGQDVAMAAAFLDRFVGSIGDARPSWQLADADDRVLAGTREAAPATAVSRVIASGGPAWTLRAWPSGAPATASQRVPVLVTGLLATLAFVWGATYFMVRAIRREGAAARLQSDFVAAVSHEFRTPLSTMRQMTEMLDTDRVPSEPRRRQYYNVLVAETARLQRLVETLLNFGRLESGGKPYRFTALDAGALVDSIVSDVRSEPGYAHRRIVVEGPPSAFAEAPADRRSLGGGWSGGPSLRLHADPDAIRLAVRNLVDNALKYSPPDSSVRVRVTEDGGQVAIAVSDEGPGIPADERATIFRRFVRGRSAGEGRVPGTGVGLAMVQHVVTAHGGEIRLESEVGVGSTFTLVLPGYRLQASGSALRRPVLDMPERYGAKGIRRGGGAPRT